MKRVLITGLTGIVGSGLYSYLKEDDGYEIIALCREDSDVSYIRDKCIIEYGSMRDDDVLCALCEKYSFDMLVHIAYKGEIERYARLAKKYGIKEVILVSSTYSLSKKHPNNQQKLLENESCSILDSYNCKYSLILPTSIFGSRPNGTRDKNMSLFIRQINRGLFPLFAQGG